MTSAVNRTGGIREPFLVDLGGIGGNGAGRHAADVGVVGPVGDPADQPALGVARGDQGQVVEMGAAGEGVVEQQLVARPERHARWRWRRRPMPACCRGAPGCARPGPGAPHRA